MALGAVKGGATGAGGCGSRAPRPATLGPPPAFLAARKARSPRIVILLVSLCGAGLPNGAAHSSQALASMGKLRARVMQLLLGQLSGCGAKNSVNTGA